MKQFSGQPRVAFRGAIALIIAFMAVMAGCSRPDSYEEFVRIEDKTADGLYHFPLDLSDSTAVYDVSFFSRIDCTRLRLASIEDFPMTVLWTSPSGVKYSEKVFFPVSSYAGSSGFYSHQYRIPYRTGIVPERKGVWDMAVRIESDRYIPGFRGLGVVCKKRL